VGEEDSTAAVAEDFMEVGAEGFAGAQLSPVALDTAADTTSADIVAATSGGAAVTSGAVGATAGAEDIGAEDAVTDGVGDLALGGHIGIGDGDIRMPITTRGITRQTLILTRTTVPRTIPPAIRILTTGTTILHRQIPTHGLSPTRTDPQDPGDHRYREPQPTRTAISWPLRRVGRFSPLTG
jgi:hypothetical protein